MHSLELMYESGKLPIKVGETQKPHIPAPRTPRSAHEWSEGSLGIASGERDVSVAELQDLLFSFLCS